MLQELCLNSMAMDKQGRAASESGLTNDGLQAKMPRCYRFLPCGETFFAKWQNLNESLIGLKISLRKFRWSEGNLKR